MFGIVIDLHDMRAALRGLLATQTQTWMGAAFVAAAMISIHYQEVVSPHVTRWSQAWSKSFDLSRLSAPTS